MEINIYENLRIFYNVKKNDEELRNLLPYPENLSSVP